MRDLSKFDDAFQGFFSNNLITGFNFTAHDPIIWQRDNGDILANMDGCAIMPKETYTALAEENERLQTDNAALEMLAETFRLTSVKLGGENAALKAERDEWRDKAMFQQGRADEAMRLVGKVICGSCGAMVSDVNNHYCASAK